MWDRTNPNGPEGMRWDTASKKKKKKAPTTPIDASTFEEEKPPVRSFSPLDATGQTYLSSFHILSYFFGIP